MKSIILMLLISTSVLGQIRYTTIDGSVVGEAGNLVLDLTQLTLDADNLVDRELILKRYKRRLRYRNSALGSFTAVVTFSNWNLWRAYQRRSFGNGSWDISVGWAFFISGNTATLVNLTIRQYRVRAYHKKHIVVIE